VLSYKQAAKMTADLRKNMMDFEENLKMFFKNNGHLCMGYDTLVQWWDAELKGVELAPQLRNTVLLLMYDELPKHPSGRAQHGSAMAIAEALGISKPTIHRVKARSKNRLTGKSDEDMVMLGFMVPNRWRKHIVKYATDKNLNMADVLRPIVKTGMRQKGVDVEEPIRGLRAARSGS
jgi:hypothetical protein